MLFIITRCNDIKERSKNNVMSMCFSKENFYDTLFRIVKRRFIESDIIL